MKYLYFVFVFFCTIFTPSLLFSQCYQSVRADGLSFLRQNQYGEAMNQFWAARRCDDVPANNDLDKLTRQAMDEWVVDLNNSVDKARKAEQEARKAQNTAVAAREAEQEARKIAEENARLARAEGKRAEALRLSLLSDIAGQNNDVSDALLLAFLALEFADDPAMQNAILPSFAKAVKDSLTRTVTVIPDVINALFKSNDGNWIAAQTEKDVFLCRLEADKISVTNLPGQQWLNAFIINGQQVAVTLSQTGNEAIIWRDGVPTPLRGHTEPVTSAIAAPNGMQILTTSRDNTAMLWDDKGRLLFTFTGHTGNVYDAVFSPDGEQVLTRSSDGHLGLWQRNGGRLIAMLGDKAAYFYTCAFSPAGNRVVGASANGLTVWDNNGRQLAAFGQAEAPAVDAVFIIENNEPHILSRMLSNKLVLWDLTGNKVAEFPHNGRVDGWTAHKGLGQFMTWTEDRQIKNWSPNGQLIKSYSGTPSRIKDVESGNGYVLSTSEEGLVRLWMSDGAYLMDWKVGSKFKVPAILSVPQQAIMYTDETGAQLLSTPLPLEVYKQMRANQPALEARLQEIKGKYLVARFD